MNAWSQIDFFDNRPHVETVDLALDAFLDLCVDPGWKILKVEHRAGGWRVERVRASRKSEPQPAPPAARRPRRPSPTYRSPMIDP